MKRNVWIVTLALFLISLYVLFLPPVAGVSDDGSLYGIMVENGLYQTDEAANFNLVYGVSGNAEGNHTTVPVGLAKSVAGWFSDLYFPTFLLTGIYLVLFLAGIYLAFSKMEFSAPWILWVVMAAAFLILGDAGYLAYFNTLTYEGAALAYFVLLCGALLRLILSEKPAVWNLVLAALAGFLFAGAAKHLFFLSPLIALFVLRLGWIRKETWWRALSFVLAVLLLAGNIALFTVEKVQNDKVSRYHALFYGALAEADEEEAVSAIRRFGLPEEAAMLAGSTYYEHPEYSADEKDALAEHISYGKIAGYYFAHPHTLFRAMSTWAKNSFFVRQDYLKHFEWDDQKKPLPYIWNTVKRMLPVQNAVIMVLLWAAFLAGLIAYRKKSEKKGVCDFGIWLLATSAVLFFLPGIAFGEAQIAKTMFPFGLAFDLTFLFLIGWGLDTVMKRQKSLKEKYGVTQ